MSRLKIYGIPMSRAFRVLWMANELELDYENVPIHFADSSSKTPEYLAINPNGKIPAIEDGGLKLWESMAINLYLAKKHDKGLWLNSPETEAQATQWSVWVMAEVEKAALAVLLNRFFLPEDQRDPKVAADGERQLQRPLKVLDEALANTGYLIGSSFTVTDLNVASVLSWAKMGHMDLSAYPHVDKWLTEALRRPASMKASGRT